MRGRIRSRLLRDARFLVILGFVLFFVVLIRTAWISDDAYITFRTVDNFIHGFGLTWNTAERVQVYTHPLWMLLLSLMDLATHEIYFSAIFLSIAISVTAVVLLGQRIALSPKEAALGILACVLSKAFIDYSTSGLENPLTHLILALFFIIYLRSGWSPRHVFLLSLLVAFAALNRMDIGLLLLPPLIMGLWGGFIKKNLVALIAGSAPFFSWTIFAVIYYGFPFPNSAYAKLHTGIGDSERIHQGFLYLLNSIDRDPLTLLVILAALTLALWRRDRKALGISSGILLYLAYIVYIGGDFMSGRFLTAPFFASVVLISQGRIAPRSELFVFLVLLMVGLSSPPTTLQSDSHYSQTGIDDRGIADERGFYYQASGLLKENRRRPLPRHDWVSDGKMARAEGGVYVRGNIGFFGFFAGPRVHVVDPLGLSDALISRLPARKNWRWRVGHYNREIPEGYIQTLQTGESCLQDKNLEIFYKRLSLITRGRLWDKNRWLAIWEMNLGRYNQLIDREAYRYPDMVRVRFQDLMNPAYPGFSSKTDGGISFSGNGLKIDLGRVWHGKSIELSLDSHDDFELIYVLRNHRMAQDKFKARYDRPSGLGVRILSVPRRAAEMGFDEIMIFPLTGDGKYSFGYMDLVE